MLPKCVTMKSVILAKSALLFCIFERIYFPLFMRVFQNLPGNSLAFAIFFLLCTHYMYSCRQKKVGDSGPRCINVEFIDEIVPDWIEEHVSSFEVIPIIYSDEYPMGQIYQVAGGKDHLVAFTGRDMSFWILSRDGRILSKINRNGEGPGEYVMPHKFTVTPDDKLVMVDVYRKLMMSYSMNGDFIEAVEVPAFCENFEYLDDSKYVTASRRVLDDDREPGYQVMACTDKMQPIKQFLPFNTSWPMGTYAPNLARWDEGIGISLIGDYNHYLVGKDLQLDTLIIFNFGRNCYDFSGQENMSNEAFMVYRVENFERPMEAGMLWPQGRSFVAQNMFRGAPYIGIGSLDKDQMVYRPLPDFKYIGVYHGFPVPLPKGIINGRIAGTMEAVDILGFWEENPEQAAIARETPGFRQIMENLDPNDNPVMVFFTLK